jgi:hypothetical protein
VRSQDDPADLVERVANLARSFFPYARCYACLAVDLDVSEPAVRDAAQTLVFMERFEGVQRICYGCSRTGETLMPIADLEPDPEP